MAAHTSAGKTVVAEYAFALASKVRSDFLTIDLFSLISSPLLPGSVIA